MATENQTNEKKSRLINLMRGMFQIDQPDLDFGLYRIMHAKKEQVETFLNSEFDQVIDSVFANRGARRVEDAKNEYESARKQAKDFGAPDPDAPMVVQQARAKYEAMLFTGGDDAEIYDHLNRFFSRYYDDGDFMSLRRYGKGAAGGAESYAVPYDGSEVVLHWANKDQYYIKTTENFSDFSFNPRQALEKDANGVSKTLFDDVNSGQALKVHFKVVDASEGAHNNVKSTDKDERYFVLDETCPIDWIDNELVIRINFGVDLDKSGQKSKWQEKRNDQLVQKVLAELNAISDHRKEVAQEYRTILGREIPKGKDKRQPLLGRYISHYTTSNTMDYFIHKDLGGFLSRELDFYLKNEVIKLDDFVGGDEVKTSKDNEPDARLKAMQSAIEKAHAIRLIAQRLIKFLAQIENFQKKLWLKKKFVTESNFCLTLDRIPETFYQLIAENERQREEWIKIFAIDEIKGDMATVSYTVPLSISFLKQNQFLVLDTANFSNNFKEELIGSIDDLEFNTDGFVVHSDNFQALRLLSSRFARSLDAIYIDPPYNTGPTEIIYKNNYKDSSWLSLMNDRIETALPLLKDGAPFAIAIDDYALVDLCEMLDRNYSGYDREMVIVNHHPQGSGGKNISRTHEYMLFMVPSGKDILRGKEKSGDIEYRSFMLSGPGENKSRTGRPNSFFALVVDFDKKKVVRIEPSVGKTGNYPTDDTEDGYKRVYPIGQSGRTQVWCRSYESAVQALARGEIVVTENNAIKLAVDTTGKRSLLFSNWVDSKYNAGPHGTKLLADMLGSGELFSYPKSLHLVKDSVDAMTYAAERPVILDFFGGSATTAHAVIELNRETDKSSQYAIVEMGNHFDDVTLPRIKKAIYASSWKDGKPLDRNGVSQLFKYVRLESYEDCLNNLALNSSGNEVVASPTDGLSRDYFLNYMLEVETAGSQSLLNISRFCDPTAYKMEIKRPGSDERVIRNVDLVETFNWLIGLNTERLYAGTRFAATFVRKPDPLLPEDANTRLQVQTLSEANDGLWWFRPVEGYVHSVPGDDRHRQSVLVLWRNLTSDPEQDAAVLEGFMTRQMKFNPNRREDKTLYDVIYINGTHNLPNLGKYGEVRLLEEEFHRRMWAGG